jgi:phage replication initiation protein
MLAEHGAVSAVPEPVHCKPRRALEAVRAEVSRNVRWLLNTAAPSVALAFRHLGDDFLELVTGKAAPGRLQSFNDAEVGGAYPLAFARLVPS